MKNKKLIILIFCSCIKFDIFAQAPGLFGNTRVCAVNAGITMGLQPHVNLSYERVRNRERSSGIMYRMTMLPELDYLSSGYQATKKAILHDIIWKWTWVNSIKGGIAPVGNFISMGLGASLLPVKFSLTNTKPYLSGTPTLTKAFSHNYLGGTIYFAFGKRMILTDNILLNMSVDVSYPYFPDFNFDSDVALFSYLRLSVGASYLLK